MYARRFYVDNLRRYIKYAHVGTNQAPRQAIRGSRESVMRWVPRSLGGGPKFAHRADLENDKRVGKLTEKRVPTA